MNSFTLLYLIVSIFIICDAFPITSSAEDTPCVNCVSDETKSRPKRHLKYILGALGRLVVDVIHETRVYAQQRRWQREHQKLNTIAIIGNGYGNKNHIHISVPNVNPYYK
ncbi:uncharacterized protein LOC126769065 [Nymphalis io]|uniref:uncharacterized protein LOC126769065 n=1 Tax=Inachis io TaxID=171585 RepID=UPI0021686B59|nr:uncharacterized protein LOC126769065 [Nymphalis io]